MRLLLLSEYPVEDDAPFTGSHLQTYFVGEVASQVCESVLVAFDHRGKGREYRVGNLRVVLLRPSRWEVARLLRLLRATLNLSPSAVYARGRSYHLIVGLIAKLLKGSTLVWSVNAQEGYEDFKYVRTLMASRRSPLKKLLLLPLFSLLDLGVALGMRAADVVTVQNERQLAGVKAKFPGKDVVLLPNLQTVPSVSDPPPIPSPYFLWVSARPNPNKRPELFSELARRLPEVKFVMVGYPMDGPPNLMTLPRMPRRKLHSLLKGATALVITSRPKTEGIPNVAIEAMLLGTPVVSLGDDFGVLNGADGTVVGGLDEAEGVLRRLVEDGEYRERISRRARDLALSLFVETSRERWREFWNALKMEACSH